MVVSAAEAAADSTDNHVHTLSLQTIIPAVKFQLFIFGLLLALLFGRI